MDDLIHKIAAELDRASGKRRLSGDEVLTRCVPRLAVLALLVKGTGFVGIEKTRLARWREACRTGFDRDAGDIYDRPADARRRWRVIERTFKKLTERIDVES